MLGILKGLKVTFEHALKPKLTQIYPYKKPELPERSRGLIQLITEKETGMLRCEACLLCEKACPPRAITINYKERGAFRRRPLFRPRTVSGFYRHRMALTAPYRGKLVPSAVDVTDEKAFNDLSKVEGIITRAMYEDWDLLTVLKAIQNDVGYVPQTAAKQVSDVMGVAMSDLYAILTLDPTLHVKPTATDPNAKQNESSEYLGGSNG